MFQFIILCGDSTQARVLLNVKASSQQIDSEQRFAKERLLTSRLDLTRLAKIRSQPRLIRAAVMTAVSHVICIILNFHQNSVKLYVLAVGAATSCTHLQQQHQKEGWLHSLKHNSKARIQIQCIRMKCVIHVHGINNSARTYFRSWQTCTHIPFAWSMHTWLRKRLLPKDHFQLSSLHMVDKCRFVLLCQDVQVNLDQ